MLNQNNILSIQQIETCPAVGYQPATVCVPVQVTPFAEAGTPITFCCGDPVVTPGTAVCTGVPNGSCSFTITQGICVEVPVLFGARSRVGTPSVDCGVATNEDVCTNCDALAGSTRTTTNCQPCKK